jgi:long-chain acyl-CoA synthetase
MIWLFSNLQLNLFLIQVFVAVPRVLNKIYDDTLATLARSSIIVRAFFWTAYFFKYPLLSKGVVTKNTFWDRLVFSKVQAKFGGRVWGMVTGSAPIDPEVLKFCRTVFGCYLLEGYGQTESAAGGFVTQYGDHDPAFPLHVGIPFTSCEYKLVDVPSLNYFAIDEPNPRGEVNRN